MRQTCLATARILVYTITAYRATGYGFNKSRLETTQHQVMACGPLHMVSMCPIHVPLPHITTLFPNPWVHLANWLLTTPACQPPGWCMTPPATEQYDLGISVLQGPGCVCVCVCVWHTITGVLSLWPVDTPRMECMQKWMMNKRVRWKNKTLQKMHAALGF